MTADNQQERPNYRLHFFVEIYDTGKRDSGNGTYNFHASDNQDARKKAGAYIDKLHKEHKEAREDSRTRDGTVQSFKASLTGLERLAYVMEEVEKTTPIHIVPPSGGIKMSG